MAFQAIWIFFGVYVCVLLSPLRQTDTGWWQTSREHRSNIWQSSPDILPSTKNNTLWWPISYFTRFSHIKKGLMKETQASFVLLWVVKDQSATTLLIIEETGPIQHYRYLNLWQTQIQSTSRKAAKSAIHYIRTVPVVVKHTTGTWLFSLNRFIRQQQASVFVMHQISLACSTFRSWILRKWQWSTVPAVMLTRLRILGGVNNK